MLIYIVGILAFLSGSTLALSVHLVYKDKVTLLKLDWREALREQCKEAYQDGYKHGMADEKIVQTAQKKIANDITLLMDAVK